MSSDWGVIFARLMIKSMLRYVIGLVALLAVFSSCESDFNLTGDYQEKALVYGLLDPNDNPNVGGDGHLFRIQKAFLGEESAFVMALSPDSSYFKYEDLFVELVEYAGTNESNRWVLDTVMIADKDTGDPNDGEIDFFGPTQRLYKADVNINKDRQYEITLKKRPTGVTNMTIANMDTVTPIADSKISIVDLNSFRLENPSENFAIANSQKVTLVNSSGDYVPYNIKFLAADRVGLYEVWLRFWYREVRDNVETVKSIEWLVRSVEGGQSGIVQVPVSAEDVFSRIGSEIPQETGVIRKIGQADTSTNPPAWPSQPDGRTQDMDVFIRFAGEDLYQYIDINNPNNTGVLQDRPVYTNINNGIGVFSSRTETGLLNRMYLSAESTDELVGGTYTSGRGFVVDPN